jgi:alpha-tubulin suppressor-like RCC1 family protein
MPFRRRESRFNTNDHVRSISIAKSPNPEPNPDAKFTYMFGASQFGQLGIGFTNKPNYETPQLIDTKILLSKITCGAGHSVALSENGKVYSWGLNILG